METGATEKVRHQFLGEWQWIKTQHGWGPTETPAQTGYTEKILFGPDNIYKKFRDGQVIEESAFYIKKEKSAAGGKDSVFVYYLQKDNSRRPLYLISADTLHTRIVESCNDCSESYFVRKKISGAN
ncbi:hypothetical protein AAE02nite_06470 [Adhaeribacter aerolatus]|uniref:Lipocalin-like domain-containing protein n=2 Tax=Adhaeribacter aerolatus TaxID=670289 RepID=A0A512ATH1_9BACT|nr:hypothetical protein AAE02nite_06470 [Adhaeribacter aerolatus]